MSALYLVSYTFQYQFGILPYFSIFKTYNLYSLGIQKTSPVIISSITLHGVMLMTIQLNAKFY